MGIRDLFKLLDDNKLYHEYSSLGEIPHSSPYIAVDINIYAHKWGSLNFRGSCAFGFAHHCASWLTAGFIPVYIFDGPSPIIKQRTVRRRKEIRKQYLPCSKELLIRLCRIFNVPYIECGGEAEAFAAELEMAGYVSAVDSADSDALAFGARRLISYGRLREYRQKDILNGLKLTRVQFIALCTFLGNDYIIRTLPPKHAVLSLRKWKTFAGVVKNEEIANGKELAAVCAYYKNPSKYHGNSISSYNLSKWQKKSTPDFAGIAHLLSEEGLPQDRIKNILQKFKP